MTHQRTSFLMPQLKVASNDTQLKHLQQKNLQNYYSQYMKNKQSNQYKHHLNPETYNPPVNYEEFDRVKMEYNTAVKNELNEAYKSQLARKQLLKRKSKEKQIQQEGAILDHAELIKIEERERMKRIGNQFKKQALQLVAEKQIEKKERQRRQKEQKNIYQQRFSLNTLSLHKNSSFNEHYKNVNAARDEVEESYKRNVLPYNKKVEERKQRITERGLSDKDYRLRYQLEVDSMNAMKSRNDLKQALLQQIREKEIKKKQDIQREKQIGYTEPMYHSMHHPINNPVDFRMTHDNKYIMNEIGTHANLSGLARNGSQSLLK